MTLYENIKRRRSVRTYLDQPLTTADHQMIETYLNTYDPVGPFGHKTEIFEIQLKDKRQLGTYGIIKRPQMYLGGICDHTDYGLLDFGYVFEGLILHLNEHQIGTCWMAGTFKRKEFEDHISFDDMQLMPAVTPLGYPEDQRLFENIMRGMVKADKKKSIEEILYDPQFTQLSKGLYPQAYDAVRLAPSSSNKQPWRLVEDDHCVHFYMDYIEKYNKALKFPVQMIDMGIAMYHFEKVVDQPGEWLILDPKLSCPNDTFKYISTFKFKD